jgi:hypothetical protein
MLFHDHFYGFRDEVTGEELCAPESCYWSEWDYALADAVTFIEEHTNQHGHLVWEFEDTERVAVTISKKVDRHEAAVQRKTQGKRYKATPGEYFVSTLHLIDPEHDDWPTYDDWLEEQIRLHGGE